MTAERSSSVHSRPNRLSRLARVGVFATVLALVSGPLATTAVAAPLAVPARVALVVPLSVQAGASGFLNGDELATLTAPRGYLTRMVDAVANQPVTLGIDPMIIASIRILGSDAPPSAVKWLNRLALTGNDSFALSYADHDITLPLQAGSAAVLTPRSLDFGIESDRFTAESVDTTATGSPIEGISVPTTEDLLYWNYSLTDVAWPYAGTVSIDDLEILGSSGYTTTIMSSANVRRTSEAFALAQAGDASLIITNDELESQLAQALEASDLTSWQEGTSRLVAGIEAAAAGAASSAQLAIAVPRGQLSDPSRLRATISALGEVDSLRLVGLNALQTAVKNPVELIDSPHSAADIGRVEPLLINEAADEKFAQVARDPELIIGERRIDLMASLAPAWNRYPGGWGVATDAFTTDSIALRSSVHIIESSEITFAADRGLLPITVENTLNQAVTVFVTVRPTTPLLSFENTSLEVEIEPNSQRKALMPAEALSNGTVQLVVSLRSAGGYRIGEPTSVTTRVQAGWETPVTLGLGVVVLLVFVVGIYRTVKRRRTEAAEPETVDAAAANTTESSE